MTAVAALIALLTAATFVGYAQSWRHWSLRQNARQFYLAARYARVLAIESGRPARLVIDRANRSFYVAQEDAETGRTKAVSNLWQRPVSLAESVSFERVAVLATLLADLADEAIVFRPDGSADGAMVQLGNGLRQYTVQVSAATARATLMDGVPETELQDRIDLDESI